MESVHCEKHCEKHCEERCEKHCEERCEEHCGQLVRRSNIHTIMYKEILRNFKDMTCKADKNSELYQLYMKNYEDQYDWWEIAAYMWQIDHKYESLAARFNIDLEVVMHMMS